MKQQVSLILLLHFLFIDAGYAATEECIANFCLETAPSETETRSAMLAKYGPGCTPIGGPIRGDQSLRYHVPEQGLWVWFDFDHRENHLNSVFITTEPLCTEPRAAKKAFQKFKTPKGARLNLSVTQIEKLSGKPDRIDDSVARERANPAYKDSELAAKYGSPVLVYLKSKDFKESLLVNMIYIKKRKVNSILISNSE